VVPTRLLLLLAVAVVTLAVLAVLRRRGVPAAVVLVIAGVAIGLLPFVPDVTLRPQDVLLGMLPLLVFDAAVGASPTALARHGHSIGYLAVGLTVASAGATAAVAHLAGHLPWATAFVLGTAVAPTDAAASISIAERLGLPRRLSTILGGEALFNDATALVMYTAAVGAATTGAFSLLGTAGSLVYACAAGAAIGLLVGILGRLARRALDDPPLEIAGSLLLAYLAYLPAEAVGASGVLAAVTAGLYLGWHGSTRPASSRSRLQAVAFRETLVFLIDSALFVLVGMSFHAFVAHSHAPLLRLTVTAALVVATVIVVRLAWMEFGGALVMRHRRRRGTLADSTWRERLVLGWSGMRGAITLAALLAVPVTTSTGSPLAHREELVYIGFVVILVTLIAQGLTLPLVIRRARLTEHPAVANAERQARLALTETVLARLDALAGANSAPAKLVDGLRAQYRSRRRQLGARPSGGGGSGDGAIDRDPDPEAVLRGELIAAQRDALANLRREGTIGVSAMRAIERDLDLEDRQVRAAG
jgi:monovalent cation/hydrogen antiporter